MAQFFLNWTVVCCTAAAFETKKKPSFMEGAVMNTQRASKIYVDDYREDQGVVTDLLEEIEGWKKSEQHETSGRLWTTCLETQGLKNLY